MAREAAAEARRAAGFCLRLALAWCFAAQLLVGQAAAAALVSNPSSAWTICHNNVSESVPAPAEGTAPLLHACCVPGVCALPLGLAPAGLVLTAPLAGPLKLAAAVPEVSSPALRWRPLYARPPPASM
jgi:hypothetical protein